MHGIIDRLDELTLSDGKAVSVVSDYKSAIKVPTINDRFIDDKFFGMECYAAMMHSKGEALLASVLSSSQVEHLKAPFSVRSHRSGLRYEHEDAVHSAIKSSASRGAFACKTGPCNWCEYQDVPGIQR